MNPIEVKGLLQEKTSAKGNNYYCIELWITPTYKKVVFLDNAEVELIKLAIKNNA